MIRSRLKRNSVGLLQGTFQSLGQVAPAADIAILLVASFSIAGAQTILAVIFGWLIYALWMVTPYQLSKFKSNAGSYYAYAASATKGGILGTPTALSFLYYDITGAAFGILGLSSFIFLISPAITHLSYIWILFAAIFTAYIIIITYLGIRPSLNYTAITGLAEVLFLLIAAIIIIIKVGPGNSAIPFDISGKYSVGFASIMFASVFSILDFTGSGVVTTISEEITKPKKNIGKSIVFAMIMTAIALIPATYALTVGWGIGHIASFASTSDAGLVVFSKYLGPVGLVLLIIFTINSYASNGVSKATAVSRWWYSAARDKIVFPESIGKINPKHRTPANAVIAWALISFVLDVSVGLIFGPEDAAFVLEAGTGISIIAVHMLANTSLTLYARRINQFNFWKHGVAPSVATIVGLIVLYFTIDNIITRWVSNPTGVNDAYLASFIITIIWIVIGGFAFTYHYYRKMPQRLINAGEFDIEKDAY
ncbi:amino acid permease [Picrophilus oshimae]|uniref:Amino acid transporter n=1 Tax=Picrophilus torridus (strain ATCC 700027 / DSM 9790 / JCM 10055 / NBRC 100828 / KAW 2/3) TaxID=1122961 RepID=Q6L0H1_PICTO|nr:amino acid permease [Picrophilus oshimae]AAT43531.1 amino acid transporter [Picrophilus oshimae DSM 9789]